MINKSQLIKFACSCASIAKIIFRNFIEVMSLIFSTATWLGIWEFAKSLKKDFKPAYRALKRKTQGESSPIPIRKGLLPLPGKGVAQELNLHFGMVFFILGIGLGVLLSILALNVGGIYGIFWLALATGAFAILSLPVMSYQIDNNLLGYYGELTVAEQLQYFVSRPEWRVFHNFQPEGEGTADIDHIIISPRGVFCLETKTLRKHIDKEVVFRDNAILVDGESLPRDPVIQAKKNGARLSQFISDKCGELVFVTPIIVFPGRSVKIEHGHYNKDIIPCSEKSLETIFRGDKWEQRQELDKKSFDKICATLEEHNRSSLEQIKEILS